jgi:hypothetical protein
MTSRSPSSEGESQPAEKGAGPARLPPGPGRTGRRLVQGLYWAIVAAICVAAATQITLQVLFQPAEAPPYKSCQEGLRALYQAVDRARLAGAGTDGENEALARFRSALKPEWGHRDGVAAQCQGKKTEEGALDAIERLRYAEEHAVRREAGELAPLRRRVQSIVDRELSPQTPP